MFNQQEKKKRYVKGYGFLFFAKSTGNKIKNILKQQIWSKVSRLDKKFATDAFKTIKKEKEIKKVALAIGSFILNKTKSYKRVPGYVAELSKDLEFNVKEINKNAKTK